MNCVLVFPSPLTTWLDVPRFAVVAPVFSMVFVQHDPGSSIMEISRVYISGVLGSLIGNAIGALTSVIFASDVDCYARRVVGQVLTLPFVWVLSLADPSFGLPIVTFLRHDIACLVMYAASSFYSTTVSTSFYFGRQIFVLSFLLLTTVALVVGFHLVSFYRNKRVTGSLTDKYLIAIEAFCQSQANMLTSLERALCYGDNGFAAHLDTIVDASRECTRSLLSLNDVLALISRDPFTVMGEKSYEDTRVQCESIKLCATTMHGHLISCRDALLASDKAIPMEMTTELLPTGNSVSLAVRNQCLVLVTKDAEACGKTHEESRALFLALQSRWRNVARHSPGAEEHIQRLRFVTCAIAIVRHGLCLRKLFSFFADLKRPTLCMSGILDGLRSRLQAVAAIKVPYSRLLERYPLRLTLSQQVAAHTVLAISTVYPDTVGEYGFWIMMPFFFCMLNTIGGSVIKGTRRVVGTILGALVAMLCAEINGAGNTTALALELCILTYLGKLASLHSDVGYAGQVFAFTWMILLLACTECSTVTDVLTPVISRSYMTVIGVIAAIGMSATVLPTYSLNIWRSRVAKLLPSAGQSTQAALVGVIEGTPYRQHNEDVETAYQINFQSVQRGAQPVSKAVSGVTKVSRESLLEFEAEMFVLKMFASPPNPVKDSYLVSCHELIGHFTMSVLSTCVSAAATRFEPFVHNLLFKEFQLESTLTEFASSMIAASQEAARAVELREPGLLAIPSLSADPVVKRIEVILASLEKSGRLDEAISGGLLRIFSFSFALVRLASSYNSLVQALRGQLQGSPHSHSARKIGRTISVDGMHPTFVGSAAPLMRHVESHGTFYQPSD